ncbi:MAG: hypothetical protein IT580_24275 [Verrucomicrobiales bacterium]|nr:hypothetical protein [Verrucomicrobiales bacterium]
MARQPQNGFVPKACRFVKALDGRQQPNRGLWPRHHRFYALDAGRGFPRLRLGALSATRRPANPAEARDRLRELQVKREKSSLVVTPAAPKFADYAQTETGS